MLHFIVIKPITMTAIVTGLKMNMIKKKVKLTDSQLLDNYRDFLTEEELLRLELKETKLAMDAAYSVLQNVTEPELIDSAIYELNSIQMKYTFLNRKYREISA